jgi:hypothetical protein
MIRSAANKVMWVGRATVFMVGLSVILALVFGVASAAFGANGDTFILGQNNVATLITRLAGPDGVDGAMFEVVNNDADTNDTALSLKVQPGEAPMTVNRDTRVANLNADKVDGREASSFANGVNGKATDSDKLDGLDSSELKPLKANIIASGVAYASPDVVSSSKLRTGVYLVTFDGYVDHNCQRAVTLADPNGGFINVDTQDGVGGEVYTAQPLHNGSFLYDSVAVFTRNSAGNLENRGFQLLVFC